MVEQETALEIHNYCALGVREKVLDSYTHYASAVQEKVLVIRIRPEREVTVHSKYCHEHPSDLGKALEILLVLVLPSPLVFLPPSSGPLLSLGLLHLVGHRIERVFEHSSFSVWQQSGY